MPLMQLRNPVLDTALQTFHFAYIASPLFLRTRSQWLCGAPLFLGMRVRKAYSLSPQRVATRLSKASFGCVRGPFFVGSMRILTHSCRVSQWLTGLARYSSIIHVRHVRHALEYVLLLLVFGSERCLFVTVS